MTTRSSSAAEAARRAAEAARRAAEAARKAAEAAAKKAAAAAAKKASEASAKKNVVKVAAKANAAAAKAAAKKFAKDELSKGVGRALRERATSLLGSTGLRGGATSLLTEDATDKKVNCLDLAADRLRAMPAAERAKTDVVFLDDTRPGKEGDSGHVLLKQGSRFVDPVTGTSYASLKQFDPDNAYRPVATMPGNDAHAILSTKPGSAERRAALEKANVPPALQKMMVADTGAPPGLDACVAPGHNDVDEATARVQYIARTQGEAAAMQRLATEAQGFTDPAQVDRLIANCRPEIDAASAVLADRVRNDLDDNDGNHATRDIVEAFATIADRAGTDGRAALGQSTADALKAKLGNDTSELNQLDDRLEDLANDGRGVAFSAALAERLLNGAGMADAANRILDMSTKAVDKLTGKYDEALSTYAQHEARLQSDLAMYGPGMTDAQKAQYVEAFWNDSDHAPVKAELDRAENALRAGLQAAGPRLEQLAKQGDTGSAKELLEGYTALAKSPANAQDALDFFARVGGDDALFEKINQAAGGELEKKLEDEILPGAIANAQGAALAAADRGDDRALERFTSTIKTMKSLGKNFSSLARQLRTLDETLEKLRTDPAGFRIASVTEGFADKSPLGKALAVASVAMAAHAAYQAHAAGDTELLAVLQADLRAVKGGLELTAGLLNTFGKGAQFADDGAKFLAGFAPYLGLAIDSINVAQDFQKVTNGGNAGDYISLIGSGVSWVGSLAGCIPIPVVAQIPDALLGTIGGIIRGVGGLVSGLINGNEERAKLDEERRQLLEAAGLSEDTKKLLTETPYLVELGMLGLDRAQFLDTARALRGSEQGFEAFVGAMDAAAAFGLTGDTALRFIDDMRREFARNPDAMYRLDNVVGWLDFHSYGVDENGDKRVLADDFQTVQIVFAQEFPGLAAEYGVEAIPVDAVNVGYFAAA